VDVKLRTGVVSKGNADQIDPGSDLHWTRSAPVDFGLGTLCRVVVIWRDDRLCRSCIKIHPMKGIAVSGLNVFALFFWEMHLSSAPPTT